MRLAKHLAHAGVASRRASEQLVFDGRVSVDGETVTDPARDVDGSERIEVDGAAIGAPAMQRVVYAVNKPAGVVSTASDTHGRPVVVDLVKSDARLYPVGRLDAETTGLILLTDDGDLANKLTHPRYEVPKTYRVELDGHVGEKALRALREGVELEDGVTAPAQVRRLSDGSLEITIREGRNRQIRRMCDAVGHRVLALERIAFGPLRLGDMAPGKARKLTPAEVQRLRDSARVP